MQRGRRGAGVPAAPVARASPASNASEYGSRAAVNQILVVAETSVGLRSQAGPRREFAYPDVNNKPALGDQRDATLSEPQPAS